MQRYGHRQAGIPVAFAISCMASPFAREPLAGDGNSPPTCGISSEFRDSFVLPGLVHALLWRRFAAQYRGEELSETAAPARATVALSRRYTMPDRLSLLRPGGGDRAQRIPLSHSQRFCIPHAADAPLLILIFSMNSAGWHLTAGGRASPQRSFSRA